MAFFLGAAFFAAGLAAVFVTRPDLVLVSTLGTSTIAGAAVEVLRGLAVFALGLAVAFLVVVAFFAGLAAAVFLTVVFLGAAAAGLAAAAAGFYCRLVDGQHLDITRSYLSSRFGSSLLLGELHGARRS